METILNVFQTVGFPIACVICLGWYLKNYIDKVERQNEERETNYRKLISAIQEEKKNLIELLNSYKESMSKIADKLDSVSTDIVEIKNKIK